MSDTSVVFNVIGRERVSSALARTRQLFRSAGQEAQRATRAAAADTRRLDDQIHDVERSLAALNAEFAATGNKELFARMKRDRALLGQLQTVRREIRRTDDEARRLADNDRASTMLGRLGNTAADVGGVLASALSSGLQMVAGNAYVMVGAALAAAAGLSALAPAAYLAGGAIGALPGIIAGAAAAMATLKLGFMGLGEQWKAQTTATGGAAKAARDMTSAHRAVEQASKQVTRAHRDVSDAIKNVARAERDVAEAQEDARRATLAVADAVAEERRRRGELARDMQAANLDVEDAVDAVQQAEEELNFARANNAGPEEIDDLDRAYRRAQLTLENSRDRVKELGDEQAKANNTAVEDSDLVRAARDREKDAVDRVRDAEEQRALAIRRVADARDAEKDAVQRLADAQKALSAPAAGGGGGGGPVPPQIAKSAQAFLDVLKQLRPAFKQLQLGVQEKLFAGLAGHFKTMATAWLPQLETTLGNFATTFNGIAKTFMTTASQPTFISNMAAGAEGVREALDKVGQAAAGPLTRAFGQLSRASKPFVSALGGEIAKALRGFSAWIDRLDKSGKLDKFFRSATDAMKDTFRILKSIGSIVGSVISAVFGEQAKSGSNPWKSLADYLERVAAWFKNPENQKKIQDFIGDLKRWGGEVLSFFQALEPVVGPAMSAVKLSIQFSTNAVKALSTQVRNVLGAVKWVAQNAPKWWNSVKDAAGRAKDWIVKKWDSLVNWFGGLKSRISRKVSGMWNGLLAGFKNTINQVIYGWNRLQFTIGGGSFAGISIPSATFGTPDIPYLADGGVVPATPGGRLAVIGEGGRDEAVIPLDRAGGLGGPTQILVSAAPDAPQFMQELVRALLPHLRYEVRTAGRGSVQTLLGTRAG